MNTIKKVVIAIGTVTGVLLVTVLMVVTLGKNKKLIKLYDKISNAYEKNVDGIIRDNEKLDQQYANLTAQEKAIIDMILHEPNLKLPPEIDKSDYATMLKWFRQLEGTYE